jgi:predicted glutamine amidotransferase
MCELLGLSSNAPSTVNISLPKLAEHGAVAGRLHDGWGIGYYEGPDVRLIKDTNAAAESDWLRFVAHHNLRSSLVIAHTRTATRGAISYANTQPFIRELAGRVHMFAHNGDLPGIFDSAQFQPTRFNPVGDTDSERAFCVLLDRMQATWTGRDTKPALRDRLQVMSSFARELRTLGPANFLYSDSEVIFAHGHRRKHGDTGRVEPPGLVMLQRQCDSNAEFAGAGITIAGEPQVITLLASVPLTAESWTPLAEGELVAVSQGRLMMQERPLDISNVGARPAPLATHDRKPPLSERPGLPPSQAARN